MDSIEKSFEVLEIKPTASRKQIKEAYLDLIKIWHPDRYAHDPRLQEKATKKTAEINLAYKEIMSSFYGAKQEQITKYSVMNVCPLCSKEFTAFGGDEFNCSRCGCRIIVDADGNVVFYEEAMNAPGQPDLPEEPVRPVPLSKVEEKRGYGFLIFLFLSFVASAFLYINRERIEETFPELNREIRHTIHQKVRESNDKAATQSNDENGKSAKDYMEKGMSEFMSGHYNRALNNLNRAISIDSGNAAAYNARGDIYCRLGQYRQGIDDYGKAVSINPKYPTAYYNRGLAYYAIHQDEMAVNDFSGAITLDFNFASAYYARGLAYYRLNQFQQASYDYNRYLKLNGNANGDAQLIRQKIREMGFNTEY